MGGGATINTVGENIIGAPKIPNNHGAIKWLFFFRYCGSNIGLFSTAAFIDIAHDRLCFFFRNSILLFLLLCLKLSLFLDRRSDSENFDNLLFAIAFKSKKERHYCCRNNWKSDNYIGSNIDLNNNQCKNHITTM